MLVFPQSPTPDVMILGAGFSHALAEVMPLTDELGNAVLERVGPTPGLHLTKFRSGEFESWLSRIAEDQPDLTTVENLRNRELFQRCSEALAQVLDDRVLQAEANALSQPWLRSLLGTLHVRQATVITFNQDTLIEIAVDRGDLYSWDPRRWPPGEFGQPSITWGDTLNMQPRLPGTRFSAPAPQPTFRFLKLHGSTNWFWRPGDLSGATTATWYLPGRVPEDIAIPDAQSALNRELPGTTPLIVPPSASKSTYYQTPLLTQLWRDARAALTRNGVQLSIIGYSLPVTDQVTSGMFREVLTGRPDNWVVPIDVVNPRSAPVCANLKAFDVLPQKLATFESPEAFTAEYQSRAARELVDAFRTHSLGDTECVLIVGPSLGKGLKVVGTHSRGQEVELLLEEAKPPYGGLNMASSASPTPLRLRDLLPKLVDETITRLVAVGPTGLREFIVGATETMTPTSYRVWQVLITAGQVH